jgi:hypothetical protein
MFLDVFVGGMFGKYMWVCLTVTPVLVSYFHRNYDDQPMDIGVHVRRWDALDQWAFSGDGILD